MERVKEIIIDIRDESEIMDLSTKSTSKEVLVLNIPSRLIFANKSWINEISKTNKIYIVCRSGNRSSKIKDKYFKDNKNVESVNNGIKELSKFKDAIKINKGLGGFGQQQYIQLVFVCLLSLILLLMYLGIDQKYIMTFVLVCVLFIGYQVYTKSCWLSSFIPLQD